MRSEGFFSRCFPFLLAWVQRLGSGIKRAAERSAADTSIGTAGIQVFPEDARFAIPEDIDGPGSNDTGDSLVVDPDKRLALLARFDKLRAMFERRCRAKTYLLAKWFVDAAFLWRLLTMVETGSVANRVFWQFFHKDPWERLTSGRSWLAIDCDRPGGKNPWNGAFFKRLAQFDRGRGCEDGK